MTTTTKIQHYHQFLHQHEIRFLHQHEDLFFHQVMTTTTPVLYVMFVEMAGK